MRPHSVSEAAQDLIECRRAAHAAISGYATASVASAMSTRPTLEAGFAQCVEPRGYRWSGWVPER